MEPSTNISARGGRATRGVALFFALVAAAALLPGCSDLDPADREAIAEPRVKIYFNEPGTRSGNDQNLKASELLVERIDRAQNTIDAALYGLSKQNIIDALVRAFMRGINVRIVGDALHFSRRASGYEVLQHYHVPMQVGNQNNIMHNKFFIIDGRYTFAGTGNITSTGFGRNNNNWVWIDSPPVARDFTDEFLQMWNGRYSAAKRVIENGSVYEVGDTTVEIYFSPQEDAMGVILRELEKAHTSIHFQIFAFTKDEVGSLFINKHRKWSAWAEENGEADVRPVDRTKKVIGVLDKSQLHGNGQFHEGYRLIASGVPMTLDANENSRQPGDYQAGGGRLHTKTMILDYGTEDARVLTGSFNWSAAATVSNDEHLIVMRGQRVAEAYMEMWRTIWLNSKNIPAYLCKNRFGAENEDLAAPDGDGNGLACAPDVVGPGDVVISEVHWDGWNGLTDPSDYSGQRDQIANDEFVELYNRTDRPIDLSLWSLTSDFDFKVGFTPGTVIMPKEHFLVLDHNQTPFSEVRPQRGQHAFANADFVLNMANDQRFPRLNLKNSRLALELRDNAGRTIDRANDGGPPFAGGRIGSQNYSMERILPPDDAEMNDGTRRSSWKPCTADQGGANVNEAFRQTIIATPGEPNSK